MPISTYNFLNKEQIKDINNLISICNTYEDLKKSPILQNENLFQDMKSYYLYYEKKELISVLIIEQLDLSEAEITGYTLPRFRRQGYFYKLLEEAMDELAYYNIFRILLIAEPKCKSGTLTAKALAEYEYSEYMLLHDLSELDKQSINHNIQYKEINHITDLNEQIVNSTLLSEYFETAKFAIDTENIACIEAYCNKEFLGICNVSLEMNKAYLFGLYVVDKFRRQGIGYSFVNHIIEICIKNGKQGLTLQVGNNINALNLYLKIGFQVQEQLDYYVFYTEEEED